jgi:hypothetical protein
VSLFLLTYLLLLSSHNNPTTSAVAAYTAVAYVIADFGFSRVQATVTVSFVAGVLTVVNIPSSIDVSIGFGIPAVLLASPAVPVVSCSVVGPAVDAFLPLLFRPRSPCYG